MKSRLDDLKAIIPPPLAPYKADGDWSIVEFSLRTSLPDDYRAFIATYGSGYIHDAGHDFERQVGTTCDPSVANPFDSGSSNNFWSGIGKTLRYVGWGHKESPAHYPYPPWPHPGGLLRWATTGNGDEFYWCTEGKPNDWKIAAKHDSSAQIYDFDCVGAVDFLVQLLGNKIAAERKFFGPFKRPVFEPKQLPGRE